MANRHFSSVLTTTLIASFAGFMALGCTGATTSSSPASQPNSASSAVQKSESMTTPAQKAELSQSDQADDKPVIAESNKSSNTASNTPDEAIAKKPAQANEIPVDYQGEIISSVKTDWNGDGLKDTALLVPSENEDDRATVLVYFANASKKPQLEFEFKNIVWQGAMYGTKPSLSVNDQGSLVIESGNDAIGRGRWNQKITAIYENNLFLVAGFTYNYRDTIDLSQGGTCDVNFLTGKGVRNDKGFSVSKKLQSLLDWTEESAPKECSF